MAALICVGLVCPLRSADSPHALPPVSVRLNELSPLTPAEQKQIQLLAARPLVHYFPEVNNVLDGEVSLQIHLRERSKGHFQSDFAQFVRLLEKIKYLSINYDAFFAWWSAAREKIVVFSQVQAWRNADLLSVVTVCWLQAATEKLKPDEVKPAIDEMVAKESANIFARILVPVLTVGGIVVLYVLKKFADTTIYSLGGGLISAYSQSLFRHIYDYASVLGTKHLRRVSVPIGQYLGNKIRRAPTANLQDKAAKLSDAITELGKVAPAVAELADSDEMDAVMWPGLTKEQYSLNMRSYSNQWIMAEAAFGSNITGAQYHGRNIVMDAVVVRAQNFTTAMATYRGVEATYENQVLILRNGFLDQSVDLKLARALFKEIVRINKELHILEVEGRLQIDPVNPEKQAALESELTQARQEFLSVANPDADGDDLEILLNAHKNVLLAADQVVASMAAQMYHDMMHPEYGLSMPNDIRDAGRIMLKQFGYPYFVKRYREPLHAILHEMETQIGVQIEENIKTQSTPKTAGFFKRGLSCLQSLAGEPKI